MAHIHEKIDFCAEVFIVHENRVLLRKHDKYKAWLSVGGHIELDEDPNQAALREVKEEVGLHIELWDSRSWESITDGTYRELIPPVSIGRHTAMHPTREDHEHVVFVYFARSTSDKVTVSHEGDRSDEWRWLTLEELNEIELWPNVRNYATQALKLLSE